MFFPDDLWPPPWNMMKHVRCNPDVAPRRNRGRVAYFWNAMSVDFRYVDVYVIHVDHRHRHCHRHHCLHHHHQQQHHQHHQLWRQVDAIPYSTYSSKGVVFLLIYYEDKLMWLLHLTYLSEGVVHSWPYEDKLMLFLFQHICQREWRMLISFEGKWMWLPLNIFVIGGGGCLIHYEDKLMWLPHSTYSRRFATATARTASLGSSTWVSLLLPSLRDKNPCAAATVWTMLFSHLRDRS